MAQAVEIEGQPAIVEQDRPDSENGNGRTPYDAKIATDPDVIVYRISGAFFFGAAATIAATLDRLDEQPKAYVIDFSAVSIFDSTAAATIETFLRKAARQGTAIYIAGARPATRRLLIAHGVKPPHARFRQTLEAALHAAHAAKS